MRGSDGPHGAMTRTTKPQRSPALLGILEGAAFCARRTVDIRDGFRPYPISSPEARGTSVFQQ